MVLVAIAARNSSLSAGGALHMHMLNDPHGRFGIPLGDTVVTESTGNVVTNESCNSVVANNDPNRRRRAAPRERRGGVEWMKERQIGESG